MSIQQGFLVPSPGFNKFPALKMRKVQATGAKKVGVILDGALAAPRTGREIAAPLPGAIEWLITAKEGGLDVFVYIGERPPAIVSAWLKRHAPGLESVVHICPKRPVVDVMLDPVALRFDGKNYPDLATLESTAPWWVTTH
jgi:hypothetical protein